MKKINIEQYNRNRLGKDEIVRTHERNLHQISPQHIDALEKQASMLNKDNIGILEYEILKQIKLYEHYGREITFDNIEEIFEDEIWILKDSIENLRSRGVLNQDGYKLSKNGNRVFWEYADEYDDGEDIMYLEDYPKKINDDQWQILEYIEYNSELKKPSDLDNQHISNWLDIDENKIRAYITDLREKEILSPKELNITYTGEQIKEVYEEQNDPSP